MITERDLTHNRGKILERLNTEEIYTINQVLEHFCVSRPYLYRLISEGKLPKPTKKVGRLMVFTEDEFTQIVESGILNHKIL